jgi:hypothetical protein
MHFVWRIQLRQRPQRHVVTFPRRMPSTLSDTLVPALESGNRPIELHVDLKTL